MKNQQGAPEALRPIQRFNNIFGLMNPEARGLYVRYEDHVAALVEAQQPTTHVQNPAEIEHAAGDVSKNGAELNTNVYAELPPRYYLAGGIEKTWDQQQMHAFADRTHALRAQQPAPDYEAGWKDGYKHGAWSTQQPAPATKQVGEVVAYLDVGANGYLDLGSELSEDALQQLPKGRHALVIAGTYGIDGYVAAPQPSPTAPAAESVLEDAARWQWLADYLIGERTDLDEGIVACATIDALRQFADAARN